MLRVSLSLACVLALGGAALAQEPDRRRKADLAAFQDFLKTQHKGKKWQTGPSPIETPELIQGFPRLRFYYVFSAPPAQERDLALLLKRLREEELKRAQAQQPAKEEREPMLSLTVAVDERGKVTPLASPADFNRLVARALSHEEARATAALILTLWSSGTAPDHVAAEDVEVMRGREGWSCRVSIPGVGTGAVHFDVEGKVVSIGKSHLPR